MKRSLSFRRRKKSSPPPRRRAPPSAPTPPQTPSPAVSSQGGTPPPPLTPLPRPSFASPASRASSADSFDSTYQLRLPAVPPADATDPHGRTLAQYRNLVLDLCHLTVSLTGGAHTPAARQKALADFKGLLRAEGIHWRRLPDDHPLRETTVRIRDPHDMHKLVCKLPPALQAYVPY